MRSALACLLLSAWGPACGGGAPGPHAPTPTVALGSDAAAGSGAPHALALAATWDQLQGPIASFTITGGGDLDYLRLQPLFRDEVGKPIDRARLREKLDQAMAGETLADVQLSGEQLASGVRLIVRVVPQREVLELQARDLAGHEVPPPPEATAMVGARLAPAELDKLVTALRDGYESAGHYRFGATWSHRVHRDGEIVELVADPGAVLPIAARVYDGAKLVKTADLDRALQGSLAVGSPWIPEDVERGALLISAYYWDHGFANVRVDVEPRPDHVPAVLTFDIREGDVFHLGPVVVTGVPPAEARRYLAAMPKVRPGVLFSRSEIAAARVMLNDDLVKRGDPKAEVLPETEVDLKKKTIALTFAVKPGS